ncbi:MAG: hypothetical protein Fur005_18310 [Roseiflexaceae bacterium]|jgi:hypothetical protein
MSDIHSPMVEVSLLIPRRIWIRIEQYAAEASLRAAEQGQPRDAVELVSDPYRLAAILLEQTIDQEEHMRRLSHLGN